MIDPHHVVCSIRITAFAVCAHLHILINTGYVILLSQQYRSILCALTNKEVATGCPSVMAFSVVPYHHHASYIIPGPSLHLSHMYHPHPRLLLRLRPECQFRNLGLFKRGTHSRTAVNCLKKKLIVLVLLPDLASSITSYYSGLFTSIEPLCFLRSTASPVTTGRGGHG